MKKTLALLIGIFTFTNLALAQSDATLEITDGNAAETPTLFKDYEGDPVPPETFDFAPAFTSYNFDITSIKTVPQNGSIKFQLYLTAGSQPGTVFDSYGISDPQTGDMYLDFNDQGIVNFALHDPENESDCQKGAGLHLISGKNGLYANYWNKIKIKYGLTGIELYLNDKLESSCEIATLRQDGPLFLGDFPEDRLELSFLGYLKDIKVENHDDEIKPVWFSDVPEDHENYAAIKYLYEQGIIEGYPDLTFQPETEVNRAEILKILLLGLDKEIVTELDQEIFPDVPTDSWFAGFVATAKLLKIIQGYPDGNYYPEQTVNRVEFLKILLLTTETDLSKIIVGALYPDTNPDEWYAPYVQFSRDHNLINLDENGNFTPAAFMTRGEVAEAMYRLLAQSSKVKASSFAAAPADKQSRNLKLKTNFSKTSSKYKT